MQCFKIAGLNLQVEGAEYDSFKELLAEYKVDNFTNPDISVNFELNNSIKNEFPEHFVSDAGRYYFETEEHCGFYDYIDELDKVISAMKSSKDWKDITYTYSDLTPIMGIGNNEAVKNILGHLFYEAVMHFEGIVVHASTIVYNGKAVTFTAPSGTGKSTHTELWKKYYPETININDDMPTVRLIDDRFYAFGTPWCGKTTINKNMSAPLHAMVFIERADECSISEITPMEAFVRMMRELPISPFKGQSDLMMSVMNKLFSKVPAYLLKCNISKDAVETVKNKLF